MSSSSFISRIAAVALLAQLAGCGFQLAGQQPLPAYLNTLELRAEDTRSDVYLALAAELQARGVQLLDTSINRFELGEVVSGQRVLSVSVRNIPREYEVYYTVSYRFFRDGAVLLERPTLTLTRDYVWSELAVLGKAREERQIRQAIVDDLVATIMRQLATLD